MKNNSATELCNPDSAHIEAMDEQASFTLRSPQDKVLSGHLSGIDDEGRVFFQVEATQDPAFPVAIGLTISDGALVKAARRKQRGIILRTDDESPRYILIGLLRERVSSKARDAEPGQLEVSMDGETMLFSAEKQIELRCGKSSLILEKDGKVVLRGAYVVSSSTGPMKIKGATIALN